MTEQPPKSEELLKTLLADDAHPQPVAAKVANIPTHIAGDDEDVDMLIDDLEHLVSEAKRVPFGKKLMIDEDRMLALIDRLRTAVPNEVKQAHRVLDEQERILSEARDRGRQMLTDRGLQAQLDVERDQVITRATVEADRIRADADKYVRNVLETLSERLTKAQSSVQKGLETLDAHE